MKIEREYRNYGLVENYDIESRKICGYALKFGCESQYMGFYETIDRSAITEDVIKESDIFALLNHDQSKVLARCRYGTEGSSLKLELRDDGLYYEFEAPNTQWGDELIEHLKRGEIFSSSFAFCIPQDGSGDKIERAADGTIHRTITSIMRLFDVSPVFEPAYLDTTCTTRTLNILDELSMKEKEIKEELEVREKEEEQPQDEEQTKEEVQSEEKEEEKEEERSDEEKTEDDEKTEDEKEEEREEPKEEQEEEPKEEEQRNLGNNTNTKIHQNSMKKNFSLLRAINAVVQNRALDPIADAVVKEAQSEIRKAGMNYEGQIQLPTETRDGDYTVNVDGEHVVATDIFDILEPLRAKNVLVEAGATLYSGLIGNVKIPVMTETNVKWEGEVDPASDGAGTFRSVDLSPKRLTAYVDISKQFLIQTENLQAEAQIRKDLIAAIAGKLESTILGNAEGSITQPQGLFYGVTPVTIEDFKDITDLEAGVEANNVFGNLKYIMDPKAKAALRNMARSADSTRLVMEDGEVDGTPALVTSHMGDNKVLYGAFENVVIGQWGAIDLTVDPYTQAGNGCVRLTVNAYFDAKVARPEALAFGEVSQD